MSMPELYGDHAAEVPPLMERSVWECKGCKTQDVGRLVSNPDGSLSCLCGAVSDMVNMVSTERAKNCPKEDDPTQVGEALTQTTAQTAPWLDGPVSREDRRRRENAQLGGTHVSNACARKNDMQQALSAVERQARKDSAETIRPDAPDKGRGQKLLDGFVFAFEKLTTLRDMGRVKTHIRAEAVRIYQLSRRHEAVCCAKGCIYSLQNKNLLVLTLGIIELVLSQLSGDEPGDGRLVEEITQGDTTSMDIRRALAQLHQLQEDLRVGYIPRLEVMSSVTRISQWCKLNEELFECDPSKCCGMTSSFFSPQSRLSCPDEFGKSALPDPGDNSEKLRTSVTAVVRFTPMDTETKAAIGYQTRQPELLDYLSREDHGLPREVVAVAIIAATARELKKDDATSDLRKHLFRKMSISSSMIEDFIRRLQPYIKRPPELDGEMPLFQIE